MEIPEGKPWKIAENKTLKWGSSPPEQRRKSDVPQEAGACPFEPFRVLRANTSLANAP
jgi:hypothetical protein